MFTISINNTSSSPKNNTSASSFAVKLRRLKIEEIVLLQNISKHFTYIQSVNEVDQSNYLMLSEFKKFCAQTKTSFKEMKQLFEDIKASTSKEMIQALDIDEIKKCIHELENNIKSFKSNLHAELDDLKSTERQLNQTLNDPILLSNLKKQPRIQTAKYAEIVSSPVKTMMTSPFRCAEVQEFQEFMKNSKNRCGGWDEYHHNIFVNLWQKYFDVNSHIEINNEGMKNVENTSEFNLFLHELTPKLLGITEKEIRLHVKWFAKFLHLKDRQQKAIENWRINRRMIRPQKMTKEPEKKHKVERCHRNTSTNLKSYNIMEYHEPQKDQIQYADKSRKFIRKCLKDGMGNKNYEYEIDDKHTIKHMKPTKQWTLKCTSKNTKGLIEIDNLENIKKLGIPLWRTVLTSIHHKEQ